MQSKLASGLPDQARAALPGQSDAQRAISFTRTLPGVDVALVGMKQSEHVDDTLQAGRL
jgi:aryl-alcohol dehydrogenase-like predicted oxidoreductase